MSSGVPPRLVNHQSKGTLPGVNPENQAKNNGKSKNLDFSKNALKASADVGAMFGFGNSISDGNKIEISSKSEANLNQEVSKKTSKARERYTGTIPKAINKHFKARKAVKTSANLTGKSKVSKIYRS